MFIKYQLVRNAVIVLGITLVGGLLLCRSSSEPEKSVSVAPPAPPPTPAAPSPPPQTAAREPLEDLARILLNERASGAKVKDLYRGKGAKVNLYDDNKDGQWDRAKVDRNRDDTWDEKWTVKAGQVERKMEGSGQIQVLRGGQWVKK